MCDVIKTGIHKFDKTPDSYECSMHPPEGFEAKKLGCITTKNCVRTVIGGWLIMVNGNLGDGSVIHRPGNDENHDNHVPCPEVRCAVKNTMPPMWTARQPDIVGIMLALLWT